MRKILSKGPFLPKSLATLGSVPWGGGQVQLPKLASPALRSEGRAGGGDTGRQTNSDLKKKYMKFPLGEKLNSRVFIQFHGSRVKSDRSSWPPLSIKWFAIQVSSTVLQNCSPNHPLATTADSSENVALHSAFSSISQLGLSFTKSLKTLTISRSPRSFS